jgi:serine/threonine protein kinase
MGLESFGEILLLERLAYGGMAEVFRGRHRGFGGFEKTVALKRILPHFAKNTKFKELFVMEANLSATLQHTNVAQVFSNGEFGGYLYLVMEFIDGKNIRKLINKADLKEDRLPLEFSCFIISEALKGLDYAHNCHDEKTSKPLEIVHQDVSPQNIMIGYDGSVKIVDFGIAKATSNIETSRQGVIRGKYSYMSPEQATGQILDRRSDIFSVGAILFELTTHQKLFDDDDKDSILEKVKACKIPSPRSINPLIPYSLERIINKALEKNVESRYSTCLEFYTDLINYLNDRHPGFNSIIFSNYLKILFKEEIAEEKASREMINLRVPEFLENLKKTEEPSAISSIPNSVEKANEAPPTPPPFSPEPKQEQDGTKIVILEPAKADVNIRVVFEDLKRSRAPLRILASEGQEDSALPRHNRGGGNFVGRFISLVLLVSAAVFATRFISFKRLLIVQKDTVQLFERFLAEFSKPIVDKPKLAEGNSPEANETEVTDDDSILQKKKEELEELRKSTELAARNPDAANFVVWDPKKLEVSGTISITGVPDANVIYIDGMKLVNTKHEAIKTPVKNLDLAPGKYKLKLENTLFGVSKTLEIQIKEGKNSEVRAVLKKSN